MKLVSNENEKLHTSNLNKKNLGEGITPYYEKPVDCFPTN